MNTITITQKGGKENCFQATISFNRKHEYPITITNPFSEDEEKRLEWYFESYSDFPFMEKIKHENAARSITEYGEKLFRQIFSDSKIHFEYENSKNSLRFEIEGDPEFHSLYWETLKDPELPHAWSLMAPMVRKSPSGQSSRINVELSASLINLLIVTSRPKGKDDPAGYRTISRPMVESLAQSSASVNIHILRPGTYKKLEEHLKEKGIGYYHVVHFDVHGNIKENKAFLSMDDKEIEAHNLADLLKEYQIPIVILNACKSATPIGGKGKSIGSYLTDAGVQLVIAMRHSVMVDAASLMMKHLYEKLFDQKSLSDAVRLARLALYKNKKRRASFDQTIELEDWILPIVYQNTEVKINRILDEEYVLPGCGTVALAQILKIHKYPNPTYGFIGRDLDVLEIERRLLEQHNILLIQGMGGAGKTTLLKHLGAWWQKTQFVDEVFYFGYDEKKWTRPQIMAHIAKHILKIQSFSDTDRQQAEVCGNLRENRHLLIMDNMESVTNELGEKERSEIQNFLSKLSNGKTFVLLGSRGHEEWLKKSTFGDNCYELTGLDPEAASILANRILERHNATKHLQDDDFKKLLDLLRGYPLALEVILPNLEQKTSADVLISLEKGDINLDRGDTQNKTESILRCIEYSFNNVSHKTREILIFLAPFTSAINNKGVSNLYIEKLKQHPLLADVELSSQLWEKAIQKAMNWGLVSFHPNNADYLQLHPIFPYFLKTQLSKQAEKQHAIETAFHQYYGDFIIEHYKTGMPVELEYENIVRALGLSLEAQTSIINIYETLFRYLEVKQDYERVLKIGDMVLAKLKTSSDEKLCAESVKVLDTIGKCNLFLKRYYDAEKSYMKALSIHEGLTIFKEREKAILSAGFYHQLGRIKAEQRKWDEAEEFYNQSLTIKKTCNNKYEEASTCHELGKVAQEQSQWEKAEKWYEEALKTYKNYEENWDMIIPDQAKEYKQEAIKLFKQRQATVCQNLGIVAQEQKSWDKAHTYYNRSLRLFDDIYSQAGVYHQLGVLADEQYQWGEAEGYYRKALKIYIDFNDEINILKTYHNLGVVAQQQAHQKAEQRQSYLEQAEDYYKQSLKYEYNNPYERAKTLRQLGVVSLEQCKWEQAKIYLLEALQIYSEYKEEDDIALTRKYLSNLRGSTSPVSNSGCLIGKAGTSEEMRILHIKSLRGRYKNKLTPSEDFARKKAGEILLEG